MHKKLDVIKDSIKSSDKLTDEQKSSSFKIIEEWNAEDKAWNFVWKINRDFRRDRTNFSRIGVDLDKGAIQWI